MERCTTWQSEVCVRYIAAGTPLTSIQGGNIGGSDGVDVWGNNYWIHDVEVTNRDECVTVKVCHSILIRLCHN